MLMLDKDTGRETAAWRNRRNMALDAHRARLLTPAQERALGVIRAEYAKRSSDEWGVRVGWGSEHAISVSTLGALERKGYIEVRRHTYDCERLEVRPAPDGR